MADKIRIDKGAAVAELTEGFRNSPATLLTEYRGLTPGSDVPAIEEHRLWSAAERLSDDPAVGTRTRCVDGVRQGCVRRSPEVGRAARGEKA